MHHISFICSSVDEHSAWHPGAVKLGHEMALVLVSETSVLTAHLVQKERDCLSLLMVSLLRNDFQPCLGALIRCKRETRRIVCAACKSQSTPSLPHSWAMLHTVWPWIAEAFNSGYELNAKVLGPLSLTISIWLI